MLDNFLAFIKKNKLISANDKLLLSLSGGIDSVTLFMLLLQANIPFEAAHCNYRLRSLESDRDEFFVTNLCKKYNIILHIKHFDTEYYALNNNQSVEMAARNLRYIWYQQLYDEFLFSKIATAHHLNDQAETFFINLFRNTGLTGICGIPISRPLFPNNHNANCSVIRPLLFANRKDILSFAAANNYTFITDSSNNEDAFLRNKIRHHVITEIEKINPDFTKQLQNSIQQFNYSNALTNKLISSFFPKSVTPNGSIKITIPENLSREELCGYLYFTLYDFNFNLTQLKNIADAINNTGKIFFSDNFQLLVDRKCLLINKIAHDSIYKCKHNKTYINSINVVFEDDFAFSFADNFVFSIVDKSDFNCIPNDNNIACLDFDKISFPLLLTRKHEGDFFYPLGMKKKKLSDFFIDNKLDKFTKNTTFALRSFNNDILWIVGYRIDNRYKIDNQTSKILMVKFH